MEVDRELEVGADLPQWVPGRVGQVGGSEVLGIRRHVDAAEPEFGDPLRFAHTALDVPGRQDRHGQEAIVRALLDLGPRVVEDLHAQAAQHVVLDVDQRLAPQSQRVGIEDLVFDTHVVEDLEAGIDVPRGHMGPLEVPLDHRLQEGMLHALPVDGAAAAGLPEGYSFDDPGAHALDVLDVEDLVLVGRRGPLRPQIVKVGEVGVGVEDGKSLGFLSSGSHVYSLLQARAPGPLGVRLVIRGDSPPVAEGVGFEPTEACASQLFKSCAFVRSAIPPAVSC